MLTFTVNKQHISLKQKSRADIVSNLITVAGFILFFLTRPKKAKNSQCVNTTCLLYHCPYLKTQEIHLFVNITRLNSYFTYQLVMTLLACSALTAWNNEKTT